MNSGDIIPLELTIKHVTSVTRPKAIKVELIRIALFGKSKNQQPVQNSIRSLEIDLDIPSDNTNFITSPRLLVPSSTPPTIDLNGKILSVQYQVRISINLESSGLSLSKPNNVVLEIPIVVATWPRPSVPIDLDLEDLSEEESFDELEDHAQQTNQSEESSSSDIPFDPSEVIDSVAIATRPVRTSSLSHHAVHNTSAANPILPAEPISYITPLTTGNLATVATTGNYPLSTPSPQPDSGSASAVMNRYTNMKESSFNDQPSLARSQDERISELNRVHTLSSMPSPQPSSPSISLPVMPIPTIIDRNESHAGFPHSYPLEHAPHYNVQPASHQPLPHSIQMPDASSYLSSTSSPFSSSSNNSSPAWSHSSPQLDHHNSHWNQSAPQLSYSEQWDQGSYNRQSDQYYPQLQTQSDPAYAPFTNSTPAAQPPNLVMPTPDTSYYQYQHQHQQYSYPPTWN